MAAMPAMPICASTDNCKIMPTTKDTCNICGSGMTLIGGLPFCPKCNDNHGEFYNPLSNAINGFAKDSDMVLIECPGATLYHPDTNEVSAGVCYRNIDDPTQGYDIISRPVYGPKHVGKRWVKKDDVRLIRRCQSCQDHTIRMRRKEGPDMYIPSRSGHNHNHRRHRHAS